ncbi:copper resistance protein CopC [Gordonia sp. PDNC005]|uniref:copper resistance CopC family protein n=1 Tax=unclassified Gordonia (in: high G+C Gram-positive bacteria) TaxID=2657482 RepID=UPI001966535C|nr:copper resistance CopC family protein [Gordonia sp. PDNC005]QRY63027.1 copper resistance protein CopC [Gordonia sp. PDNC005]
MFGVVKRSAVVAVVIAFAALIAGVLAGPAAAHSALTGSSPENGASIATAPDKVTLTFNEDLQPAFATVKVVGPDNNFWQTSEPIIEGRTASVTLNGLGPAGDYEVNYRVTSADGHPVSGQTTFTLTKAGTGTPGAAVPADYQAPESSEHGVKAWPIVLGVVAAVIVIGGAVVFTLVKRRR